MISVNMTYLVKRRSGKAENEDQGTSYAAVEHSGNVRAQLRTICVLDSWVYQT